jgi:hypothetical protein
LGVRSVDGEQLGTGTSKRKPVERRRVNGRGFEVVA